MAEPFASSGDLEERWPSLPSEREEEADVLLGDASVILRAAYPDIDSRVTSGGLDPDVPIIVACNMVKRAMLATTPGAASESDNTGPYGRSVTWDNPNGNLYILAAEDRLIRGQRSRAMSVAYGCP